MSQSSTTTFTTDSSGTSITPSYFKSQPTHWTEFQLLFSMQVDSDFIKSHVHELSNVRFPLVWHPPPIAATSSSLSSSNENSIKKKASITSGDSFAPTSAKVASLFGGSSTSSSKSKKKRSSNATRTPTPIAVHGAFEVGAHIEQTVVQPKFTWTPLVQPNFDDDDDDEEAVSMKPIRKSRRRELFLSGSAPPQVELLSIIRVHKPTRIDRNQYPYARLDRVCCVKTNDSTYPDIVFEARSTKERDWLVFSLKLIVARRSQLSYSVPS